MNTGEDLSVHVVEHDRWWCTSTDMYCKGQWMLYTLTNSFWHLQSINIPCHGWTSCTAIDSGLYLSIAIAEINRLGHWWSLPSSVDDMGHPSIFIAVNYRFSEPSIDSHYRHWKVRWAIYQYQLQSIDFVSRQSVASTAKHAFLGYLSIWIVPPPIDCSREHLPIVGEANDTS